MGTVGETPAERISIYYVRLGLGLGGEFCQLMCWHLVAGAATWFQKCYSHSWWNGGVGAVPCREEWQAPIGTSFPF